MKVGDKVKVLVAFAGPGGTYPNSTENIPVFVDVTEDNINYLESVLIAGFVELIKSEKEATEYLTNEDTDFLSDRPKARKGGRKRTIQPEEG